MNLRHLPITFRPKIFFLLLLFAIANGANAQTALTMKKPYSGAYSQGATLGIYIFDDGQFALVAYATFLTGKYTLKGKAIHMKVDVPKDDFVILGRKEPSLKGKTKLTFNTAFAGTPVFIRFDNEPLKLVFDKTTNYVRSEYVSEVASRPAKLALTVANPEKPRAPNTTVFSPPADFNDLLILYNEPSSDPESFDGTFEKVDGEMVLKMNGDALERDMDDTEMLQIVRRGLAGREGKSDDSSLYFNDQLKSATGRDELSEEPSTFSKDNYVLDVASNKLIRKGSYTAGKDYSRAVASDYHDETYLLEYRLVPVLEKKIVPLAKDQSHTKALMKAESRY